MTRLILIRHGYSKNNKEKKFTGQMDVPLDNIGFSQAEATAKFVLKNYKVDAIYSSDLLRAYDTVKPIAEVLNLPVTYCKGLREIDVGKWQGMFFEDIKRLYPEKYLEYKGRTDSFRFEGGESFEDLKKRVVIALEKIDKENMGKTIVIGTHGGVIRALLAAYRSVSDEKAEIVPNGSVTVAEYNNGRLNFVEIGNSGHLEDKTEWAF